MKKNKYAQIIPALRLKRDLQDFTYLIPEKLAPIIKVGQLVEIPFRNKIVQGVILNLATENNSTYKLKAIKSIIDPQPFLYKWQLKLINFVAKYYFVSPAVVCKMMIPQIPKKQRQSQTKFFQNLDFKIPEQTDVPINKYWSGSKPVLVRYSQSTSKINLYLALIAKALKNNKQIVIIVPQLTEIKKIYEYLAEYKNITSVFLNDLSKNKFWQEWLKIKKGQSKIIIGTRSAIFAPFIDLGLIIIDQEDNENHKQEEPNPRYNVITVAEYLTGLLKNKLFLTAQSPSLLSLAKVQQKRWQYLILGDETAIPQIKIIDRQDEFKKGNYSIISEYLAERMTYNLQRARKIFLFLNRKGLSSLATCEDCGHIAQCPTCKLPLTLHLSKKLICHHCNWQEDLLLSCPKCRGTKIKLTGSGTEKLEQDIKAMFPQARILKLDQETPYANQDLNNFDIFIGTQYAFDWLDWSVINLLGVINADILLYLPDYRGMEKTFNLLVKMASNLGESSKEMVVQTFSPLNYVFYYFPKFDYKNYFLQEIKARRTFNYPPYGRLIRLIYQSIEFRAGQQEITEVYNQLKKEIDQNQINLSAPILAYTQQVRGRWRWQIIMRTLINDVKLDFLNKLPENIIIDVDPESLI